MFEQDIRKPASGEQVAMHAKPPIAGNTAM